MQGAHRGHRAGQIRADRAKSGGDIFEHRDALSFPARRRSVARRPGNADRRRCAAGDFLERRNGRVDRAGGGGEAAGRAADDANGRAAVDAGGRERHSAGYRRERRGVFAESRADGFDGGGSGHGRRAGYRAAGAARIPARGFCGAASGRAAGQEIAARRDADARRRGCAARAAGGENAGRDLRDEPQGPGPGSGDRSGRASFWESLPTATCGG